MPRLHYLLYLILFSASSISLFSQDYSELESPLLVTDDTSDMDSSAILHIASKSKGILIPRMTRVERELIERPATGLLVFVTDTNSFWYFDGTVWKDLKALDIEIVDTDEDTYISVEAGIDNDEIIAYASDKKVLEIDTFSAHFKEGISLLFGRNNSGAGTRLFWNNIRGSIRSGSVSGTQWNDSKTGYNSAAFGVDNTALGTTSMSWGENNTSTGHNSSTWGESTQAMAARSTAWGKNTSALANDATAWGSGTTASDTRTTAWGDGTTAGEAGATAWGAATVSNGLHTTTWGSSTNAIGTNGTAFGNLSRSEGENSTAFGNGSIATGQNATAWGDDSAATGRNATAWGNEAQATGGDATAWNFGIAIGQGSTAFNGGYAAGDLSTAIGAVPAMSYLEVAVGYNGKIYTPEDSSEWNMNDRIFSVGAGTPTTSKNAITILKNGNFGIGTDTPKHQFHLLDEAVEAVIGASTESAVLTIDGVDSSFIKLKNDNNLNFKITSLPGHLSFSDSTGFTALNISSKAVTINGTSGQDLSVHQTSDTTGLSLSNAGNNWTLATDPSAMLVLRLNGIITGFFDLSGNYMPISDRRAKVDILPIPSVLDKIKQLSPVTYQMKNGRKQRHTGFIAQQVAATFSDIAKEIPNQDRIALNYDGITAINTKAIQELMTEIELLKSELKSLKEKLESQNKVKE